MHFRDKHSYLPTVMPAAVYTVTMSPLSLRLLEEGSHNLAACGYIPSLVSRHSVDALASSVGSTSV